MQIRWESRVSAFQGSRQEIVSVASTGRGIELEWRVIGPRITARGPP